MYTTQIDQVLIYILPYLLQIAPENVVDTEYSYGCTSHFLYLSAVNLCLKCCAFLGGAFNLLSFHTTGGYLHFYCIHIYCMSQQCRVGCYWSVCMCVL